MTSKDTEINVCRLMVEVFGELRALATKRRRQRDKESAA